MTSRRLALFATLPALSAIAFAALPCARSLADYQSALDAYLRGEFASAFKLALPSALEGDPKSRIGLGLLLARGHGVKANIVRSYSWFDLVASQPEPEFRLARMLASINRDYLRKQMSAEQLAAARLRTAMMQATPKTIASAAQFGFSLASHADKTPPPRANGSVPANGAASALAAAASRAPFALLQPVATLYRIQLAALPVGNTERLRSKWSRLSSRHAALRKLQPLLIRMDLGDFGAYEGLRAGAFDDTTQAYAICGALLESGQDCFVVAK
ncbi:MAG: hypothetical protein GEU87_19210 [Alphaproteobacteria bacterium]|nr:hypothetical protein [Alphaproteobacteria bacterium]